MEHPVQSSPSRHLHKYELSSRSGPIEIPTRGRSAQAHAPHASPSSPELVFEMSPFDSSIQSYPSPRSFGASLARWNDDELVTFQSRLARPVSCSPSPAFQCDPYTLPHSSSSTPKDVSHLLKPFSPCSPQIKEYDNKVRQDTCALAAPPIIRTAAIHKIYGFTPEKPCETNPLSTSVKRSPRRRLSPSRSTPTTLPWVLPGSCDANAEEEDYCTSQSPAAFDFKRFLFYRLEKRRVRGNGL